MREGIYMRGGQSEGKILLKDGRDAEGGAPDENFCAGGGGKEKETKTSKNGLRTGADRLESALLPRTCPLSQRHPHRIYRVATPEKPSLMLYRTFVFGTGLPGLSLG